MIPVSYENLCPSCGSSLLENELQSGICDKTGRGLCSHEIDDVFSEFSEFFRMSVGELRALQKFWGRRILEGESFTAVAPTGIGKTTFGIAMALFLAKKKKRSYLIFPTTVLIKQTVERLSEFSKRSGIRVSFNRNDGDVVVAYYFSGMKKKEVDEFYSILSSERYHILVTTSAFLSKNFDRIGGRFSFVFVDDVDAVLRASRNVDRILQLIGFKKINGKWTGKADGVLMVSTATGKPGIKAKLFRKLLGFDVGARTVFVRNIYDIYVRDSGIGSLKQILSEMGPGGLVYAGSSERASEIFHALEGEFKIGHVSGKSKKDVERFESGEIDYLVGTSHYYGSIVRGLDLPERIRYVVFLKAPVFRVKFDEVKKLKSGYLKMLAIVFRDDEKVKKYLPHLDSLSSREFEKLKAILINKIEHGDFEGRRRDVVVRKGEIVFPDMRTYIQGSGRASRLFAGGITKGASFLLEDDPEILDAFIERSRIFDIEFRDISQVDTVSLIKEIDKSRIELKKKDFVEDVVKPTLFIVESPTKARQIARFFGRASVKVLKDGSNVFLAYEVPAENRVLIITASFGHLTDLITGKGFHGIQTGDAIRPIYSSIKKCRKCGYQFTEERTRCIRCGGEDIDDSKSRIKIIRKLARETGNVIIGTDPDAEGEKIAWDIANLLKGCGDIKRAEFHEITQKAVINALNSLRDIDENLVKAQMIRRIEDRWIGFVLSQKLWEIFGSKNLSAGRAQTPVLGWVIESAEKNRKKRKIAYIPELDLYIEEVENGEIEIEVELVNSRKDTRAPLPPHTTDTMLRDAGTILKLPVRETMDLAQDLFESGLITYHRTDSTTVSEAGMKIAREYLQEDFYGRKWQGEGAHECIRPTRSFDRYDVQRMIHEGLIHAENITWKHLSLYDLIFRRFMASQAHNLVVDVREYRIKVKDKLIREERVVKATGRAYDLYKSVHVKCEIPEGRHRFKAKILRIPEAPLLTQSDLVSMMRERGIGRPSTYSTIVEKLFERKYIIQKSGKLIPTGTGKRIYSYLVSSYGEFVSEERTRIIEQIMNQIERGEADYSETLKDLYSEIRKIL